MAKVNRPPARQLITPRSPQSLPHVCLACNWRKLSAKALMELVAKDQAPPDFTGFLSGYTNLNVVLNQYHMGKQVGMVSIPLGVLDSVMGDVLTTASQYLAILQAQNPATEAEAVAENGVVEATDVEGEEEAES